MSPEGTGRPRAERAAELLLVAFAGLLGLLEGPAEIACALSLIALVAAGRGRGRRLGLPELALLLWVLAGLPGMLRPEFSARSQGMLRPLLALGYWVGALGLRGPPGVARTAALAFVATSTLNAGYGWVQVFVADLGLETLLRGRAASEHLLDPDAPGRLRMATGLFHNRLKLAHVGVVALACAAPMVLRARGRRRSLAVAAAVVIAGGVLLSFRRAAPAALLVAAALVLLAVGRRRAVLGLAAVGAVLVLGAASTGAGRERLDTASLHLDERLGIYAAAVELWREAPIFGVGHGGYPAAIVRVAPEMKADLTTSPHNQLLHALTETGLVGLLGFAFGVGGALLRALRRLRARRDADDLTATRDRVAATAALALLGLGAVHAVLFHTPVALAFWAALGAAGGPDADEA